MEILNSVGYDRFKVHVESESPGKVKTKLSFVRLTDCKKSKRRVGRECASCSAVQRSSSYKARKDSYFRRNGVRRLRESMYVGT